MFWFCSCSSLGVLWNCSTHHSTLLSCAEHWGRPVQSDLLPKLQYTSSLGSYLQQSPRPNILLKHWQVWDFARLSSKPLPVFVHPLSKEMLPNVKPSFACRVLEGKVWCLPTGYSLLFPTYWDRSWKLEYMWLGYVFSIGIVIYIVHSLPLIHLCWILKSKQNTESTDMPSWGAIG